MTWAWVGFGSAADISAKQRKARATKNGLGMPVITAAAGSVVPVTVAGGRVGLSCHRCDGYVSRRAHLMGKPVAKGAELRYTGGVPGIRGRSCSNASGEGQLKAAFLIRHHGARCRAAVAACGRAVMVLV